VVHGNTGCGRGFLPSPTGRFRPVWGDHGGVGVSVVIRYLDGCPSWQRVRERLRAAAREVGVDLDVRLEPVETLEEAQRLGLPGSPTILLEGVDPFARPGSVPAVACRLYDTPAGPAEVPTIDQLATALRRCPTPGLRHSGVERR
jgi:hypothetical protein